MPNKNLYGKYFTIPSKFQPYFNKNIISYQELHKIKSEKKVPDVIYNWANNLLNHLSNTINKPKEIQKDTGIYNKYKKTHYKNKFKNPTKPYKNYIISYEKLMKEYIIKRIKQKLQ